MNLGYCIKRSILFVHCVGVVLSASYYQREYAGYLFTIPGFNDTDRHSRYSAQTWCNGNGSKLLTITNQSIQDAVVTFINQAIRDNQMTGNPIVTDGFRRNIEFWTWINETTPTELNVPRQGGGRAASYAGLSVSPSSSGLTLHEDASNNKRYFICEGPMFCGYGYQYQNQCYQSFRDANQTLSWFDARNVCLQRGGDLATFEFILDIDDLHILSGSWLTPSSDYWIGLRRERWIWQNTNSDVTYSQWSDGRPNYYDGAQCLCLLPNTPVNDWKWSECGCGEEPLQFVCISSAGTVSTTSSTTTSTLTTHSLSTTTSSTTTTTQSDPQAENSTGKSSHFGVGLGIGIPLLLMIIAL